MCDVQFSFWTKFNQNPIVPGVGSQMLTDVERTCLRDCLTHCPHSCPQEPLCVWSAKTEVLCVRPSPGWSWRTSGSSACVTSSRQPTAAKTGRSTFWLAATFEPGISLQLTTAALSEAQSEMRADVISCQPFILTHVIPGGDYRRADGVYVVTLTVFAANMHCLALPRVRTCF